MNIDTSRLGNMKYGEEIATLLRKKYIGKKITDVGYDYFAEEFYMTVDNNMRLYFEKENKEGRSL